MASPPTIVRDSEWRVLDALPALVAIVGADGRILATNASWDRRGLERGGAEIGVGADYFDVCRRAGPDHYAQAALAGMQRVLRGEQPAFDLAYPCPKEADDESWFLLQATRAEVGDVPVLVVMHSEASALKRALDRDRDDRAESSASRARERERRSLDRLGGNVATPATQRAFGLAPLVQSQPGRFAELKADYERAFRTALEARVYKTRSTGREMVRALADNLAFLRASPRDVVDLHQSVLVEISKGGTPAQAQACFDEGRVLVVELMGELAACYRAMAVAGPWTAGAWGETQS